MSSASDALKGILCASWWTLWSATDDLRARAPPRHSDFRDNTPPTLLEVMRLYEDIVQEGKWTNGLIQMWNPKNKTVKSAVHIPCFDSFKWNPFLWRGLVLGRTCQECYWTGLRQTRWSRAVYAANLGREYIFPYRDIGRHGYQSDLKALCWMYCLLSCVFSCGIGQVFSFCGNIMFNFGAFYSCHARRKLRHRYKLPPTFGLPPGFDDFLVHFICSYCASHQELRELAARGVDGPGMHILDVLPDSFSRAPRSYEAAEARRALRERLLAHPPSLFSKRDIRKLRSSATVRKAVHETEQDIDDVLGKENSKRPFGWVQYAPPKQHMQRIVEVIGAPGAGTRGAGASSSRAPGGRPDIDVDPPGATRPSWAAPGFEPRPRSGGPDSKRPYERFAPNADLELVPGPPGGIDEGWEGDADPAAPFAYPPPSDEPPVAHPGAAKGRGQHRKTASWQSGSGQDPARDAEQLMRVDFENLQEEVGINVYRSDWSRAWSVSY